MAKKKMTIEDLAGITKKGFDGVDRRFEQVDKRFDAVDRRFDAVDKRFEHIETRMEDGFRNVNDRLDMVERDVAIIREHIVYRSEFEDLVGRMKYVERKLGIKSGK